eukprot:1235712-Rhodomonas_salina.3
MLPHHLRCSVRPTPCPVCRSVCLVVLFAVSAKSGTDTASASALRGTEIACAGLCAPLGGFGKGCPDQVSPGAR